MNSVNNKFYLKYDGNTPLHFVCREGDVDIARCLLYCGAVTTIKNKNCKCPLDGCQNENRNDIENLFAEYNPERG